MPRGKISPRLGGVGWVSQTPPLGIVWEMRRLAKMGVAPLGRDVMKRHSGTLRAAFRKYQITRKGAVTATSRRRVRDLIAKRAGKVLLTPKSETWSIKLLDALYCRLDKPSWERSDYGQNIPTRDKQFRIELHHLLRGAYRKNDPPTARLQDLERALDGIISFTPSEVEALKLLAEKPYAGSTTGRHVELDYLDMLHNPYLDNIREMKEFQAALQKAKEIYEENLLKYAQVFL